jgi:hypothetical protein
LDEDTFEDLLDEDILDEDIFDDDSEALYWQVRQMPAFTLQPFVENAIRHGISLLALSAYNGHREGVITIHVKDEGEFLRCTIEDNGVGRTAAAEFKNRNNGEWRHLSMSTTAIRERLKLLQEAYNIELGIFYEDLISNDGAPFGTRVTLLVPCSIMDSESEMQPRVRQSVSPSAVISSSNREVPILQVE